MRQFVALNFLPCSKKAKTLDLSSLKVQEFQIHCFWSTYLLIFNKFCSWTFWKTSIITILNFVVLESSITSITKFLTYLKDQSHQSQSFWRTWKINHINHDVFEINHINLNKYKTLTTLVFSKHTRKIVRCTLKVQNTTNTKWQVHCTWHSLGEILFEKAQKLFTLLN